MYSFFGKPAAPERIRHTPIFFCSISRSDHERRPEPEAALAAVAALEGETAAAAAERI